MEDTYLQDMGLALFEQDPQVAQEKLIRYWREAYFNHVPGNIVMTRALL